MKIRTCDALTWTACQQHLDGSGNAPYLAIRGSRSLGSEVFGHSSQLVTPWLPNCQLRLSVSDRHILPQLHVMEAVEHDLDTLRQLQVVAAVEHNREAAPSIADISASPEFEMNSSLPVGTAHTKSNYTW
jgi:hypothetical protein